MRHVLATSLKLPITRRSQKNSLQPPARRLSKDGGARIEQAMAAAQLASAAAKLPHLRTVKMLPLNIVKT